MKKQNGLKVLLLVSIIATMTACSKPSTAGDNESASISATSTAYISCSQGSSYNNVMTVNIRSVLASEIVRSDFMRLKFTSLNPNFSVDGGYLKMFRWQVAATGEKYLDTTAVSFRAESIGGTILTNYSTTLNWSDLAYARMNQNATTVSNLFSKMRFTANVRDSQAEYQVLKIVYYDSNDNVVDQVDLLMPLFSAHPTNYSLTPAGTARPTILQNLHPFRNLAAQGYSPSQILSYSEANYCF